MGHGQSKRYSLRKESNASNSSKSSGVTHLSEEDLREAFSLADKNGDGSICFTDLKSITDNLGFKFCEEEIQEMIVLADSDSNGSVCFNEFKDLMAKGLQKLADDKKSANEEEKKKTRRLQGFLKKMKSRRSSKYDEQKNLHTYPNIAEYDKIKEHKIKIINGGSNGVVSERAEEAQEVILENNHLYLFKFFDKDGNGLIDMGELDIAMNSLLNFRMTMEEIICMMKNADLNGDGVIDIHEFQQLINNLPNLDTQPLM